MPRERGMPADGDRKHLRSRSRSQTPPRKRPGAAANQFHGATSDPSPPRSRSPARQLKRPGVSARISQAEREAARHCQDERDRETEKETRAAAVARGVGDVVKQHYNAVPERGRDWRKTDSKIKGLRNFNNWVKSCLIHKFAPGEEPLSGRGRSESLRVLDIGCGKGGDLQKWQSAPRHVQLYVGVDPADVSINQARARYEKMKRKPSRGRQSRTFHAEFFAKDGFDEWLGEIPIIRDVGIDRHVGPDRRGGGSQKGGGFDVVTMMFCMHYAFESEHKARGMLRNVAGSLKKGGRFIGVIPNSDVLSARLVQFHNESDHVRSESGSGNSNSPGCVGSDDDWDPEQPAEQPKRKEASPEQNGKSKDKLVEWGNSIYSIKFKGKTPANGVFRPPFGWKYFYFLEEAVESIPEYVVPWGAFRALAEEYDLELQYQKPFSEIWTELNGDPILGPLSERMHVRERWGAPMILSLDEMDAAALYHAFCFRKC